MTGNNVIAAIGVCTCAIGLTLIAFPDSSVNAAQPPQKRCVAVVKEEYDSAKRQNLLRMRFSTYVKTGRLGRHYYWYCHA
jgi:hypothetical protein